MNKFLEIFHQNYSLEEDGIPPHWCVKYVNKYGMLDYEYFSKEEDAYSWIKENTVDS